MRDTGKNSVSILGDRIQTLTPEPAQLPLVSFVLRNWNYAEFVGVAIDSIRVQDYPRFECIVVDNGSTDNSREVIARHVGSDSRFRIVHTGENLGPMGGALYGLELVQGEFVAFVDSDDYLFPSFASAHVQAHLALPRGVAFSSNDVIEIGSKGAVLSGSRSALAQRWEGGGRIGLRPAHMVPRLATVSDEEFQRLHEAILYQGPNDGGALWAPGTANMFKKFALDIVRPLSDAQALRRMSADGHFCRLCQVLGGSVLIGVPLSAYRIHDRNHFTGVPSLGGVNPGGGAAVANLPLRRCEAARVIVEQLPQFHQRMRERLWTAIDRVVALNGTGLRQIYAMREMRKMIAANLPQFLDAFGEKHTVRELRHRMSSGTLKAILREAHGGSIPARLRRQMLREELRHAFKKRRGSLKIAAERRGSLKIAADRSGPSLAPAVKLSNADLQALSETGQKKLWTQVEALISLYRLLDGNRSLPPTRGWAISPDLMLHLAMVIREMRPQLVVECGSGSSTVAMAMILKQLGGGHIISLEHDEDARERTAAAIRAQEAEEYATVLRAPLTSRSYPGFAQAFNWYDLSGASFPSAIDLLFIDGPPGSTNPHARYPAGPELIPRVRPGGRIIVDDASRADEKMLETQWKELFPAIVVTRIKAEKGAYDIIVGESPSVKIR